MASTASSGHWFPYLCKGKDRITEKHQSKHFSFTLVPLITLYLIFLTGSPASGLYHRSRRKAPALVHQVSPVPV